MESPVYSRQQLGLFGILTAWAMVQILVVGLLAVEVILLKRYGEKVHEINTATRALLLG